MVVAYEEKLRLRRLRKDREDIDRLERILQENPDLIPAEAARIRLIVDDLKRRVAHAQPKVIG